MNALDQAFIRAFAKDHTEEAASAERSVAQLPARTAEAGAERVDPPASHVDPSRQVLVLHELYQTGRRRRIDSPHETAGGVPRCHLSYSTVEHMESYDPRDVARLPSAHVVVEDRTLDLDRPRTRVATPAAGSSVADVERRRETAAGLVKETSSAGGRVAEPVEDPSAQWAREPRYVFWVGTDVEPALVTCTWACRRGERLSEAAAAGTALDTGVWRVDPSRFERVAVLTTRECSPSAVASEREQVESAVGSDGVVGSERDEEREADHVPSDASHPGDGGVSEESFQPAWEVDAFRWPEICGKLDATSGGKLEQSGRELFVATRDGLKTLAVTALQAGEGVTTLVLSLAQAAAKAGSRVALLEAHDQPLGLARSLGLDPPCDWREVTRQGESLAEAAIASLHDSVTLFPIGSGGERGGHTWDANLVRETVAQLQRHFDLVIVDLPPMNAWSHRDNQPDVPCGIDMAVVVRSVSVTAVDRLLLGVARLRSMGICAVGVVENFSMVGAVAADDGSAASASPPGEAWPTTRVHGGESDGVRHPAASKSQAA